MLFGAIATGGLIWYRLFGGPMEGTAWDIQMKADSVFSFSRHDRLIFERGKLRTEKHRQKFLSPGAYTAKSVGGDVDALWSAAMTDDSRGTMTWHGLVRGDTIEGVAILVTKDGREKRFTFTGKRA
jgi:hypothetical protein